MRRSKVVAVAVVLLLAVLSACSGKSEQRNLHPTGTPLGQQSESGNHEGDADIGSFTFDPSRLERAPDLSEYQRTLLADGELTFGEYDRAVLDYVACVEKGGITVQHVEGDAYAAGPMLNRRWQYEFSTYLPHEPGKPATMERMQSIERPCGEKYLSVVVQLWAEHTAPTAAELRSAREQLAACLRTAGFQVPIEPSGDDFGPYAAEPAYYSCSKSVSEEMGIPGFGG